MKKRNKFLVVLLLSIMFVGNVKAASMFKTTSTSSFSAKEKVTLRSEGYVTRSGYTVDKGSEWGIYYKHSSDHFALCTSFSKANPDATYECKREDSGWSKDNAVASGIAAIIIHETGGLNKTMSHVNYFNAELAINRYLSSTKYAKSSNGFEYFGSEKKSVNDKIDSLSGVAVKAVESYNKFENAKTKKKMKISLGAVKCTGNNCSVKVSTSGISEYDRTFDKVSIENPTVTVTNVTTGNTIASTYEDGKIKFAKPEGKVSVQISTNVVRTYYVAQNYNCGSNQSVTLNKFKAQTQTVPLSASKEVTFTTSGSSSSTGDELVVESNCDIRLYKVNMKGEPLEGSVFDITETDASNVSRTSSVALLNPQDGSDILNGICISKEGKTKIEYRETQFPAGYGMTDEDAQIIASGGLPQIDLNQEEYYIRNKALTDLIVKKVDGDTNKLIKDSVLAIYDGNTKLHVAYTQVNGSSVDENGNKYIKIVESGDTTWTTEENVGVHFVGLDYDVNYRIVEESAPQGYIKNNQVEVVTLTQENPSATVVLKNYESSISISKQDITSKKEIPGAHLQILDGQGNVVEEWISTDQPHKVTTLTDSTYYLVETIAPNGYELNTSKIEFIVHNGEAQKKVVMYNSPNIIKVANTLLNKRTIIYVFGGILIIAGAGVLGYEIKKKKLYSK